MKPLATVPVNMRRSGIREVMELAAGIEGVIHLEVGEPDSGTPPEVIEAAFAAARKASRGTRRMRACRPSATPSRPSWSARTDSRRRLRTWSSRRAPSARWPPPSWPRSSRATRSWSRTPAGPTTTPWSGLAGGAPVPYPLRRESGFLPDLDVLDRLVGSRTKLIITNSPNNPTGAFSRADGAGPGRLRGRARPLPGRRRGVRGVHVRSAARAGGDASIPTGV